MARGQISIELYHLQQVADLMTWAFKTGALLRTIADLQVLRKGDPLCDRLAEAAESWESLELDLTDPDAEPDEERPPRVAMKPETDPAGTSETTGPEDGRIEPFRRPGS